MNRVMLLSAAMVSLASSACASYEEPAVGSIANSGLAGTSWQLVSFTSMDDTQGVTYPRADAWYRMDFLRDGELALVLDCNRGSANWSEGIANATGGSIEIGEVASTRALCAQPDVGERMARYLPDVASYRLANGNLFLALREDGGVFEFKPN